MFVVARSSLREEAAPTGGRFRSREVVLVGDVAFDVDAADVEQAPQSNEEGRLYVDVEERERGNAGPFFALYRDPELERRYGWYCASCGSTETAMDPMGRVTCGECDNTRQPTRWDAAYL